MSCWMKELILDMPSKYLIVRTLNAIPVALDITSHWTDHYKHVYTEGNWHWPSTLIPWDTIVVPTPTCEKRVVTSMSIYNPNPGITGTFQLIEVDSLTWVETVITQKTLNTADTWTLECICTCCGTQTTPIGDLPGVMVSWDGVIIDPQPIQQIDFASCLRAQYDILHPHIAFVDIDLNPSFLCDFTDPNNPTATLTLCDQDVDMSCIFSWMWGSVTVKNTIFVMKNGNDWTGMAERFDRPFLTINAAISAWETLYSATNIPVDIIVYAGDYKEEILLANNVNVYFHKSTIVRGIQTKRENVISKVTGHVSIHAWYRDPSTNRWYAIFSRHDWCEVAIDADLIFQDSENWEESRLIHLRCRNAKRKINVWSIRTKEDMHRMIRQIWIEWVWTTLDYSCHLWNTMPLRHNFYNVSGQWCELHWTHSNVIQRGILIWTPNPITVPNYPSFINSANERSRVYIDNVFIKWHYIEGGNDCTRWRFKSINDSVVAFNDFMLDMFPNTGNSRKRPVFWCENASYMLRYGKSMIRCNSTYDNVFTFNDTNATMYMFGNIICNRNPGTLSWFAYYQSAGVNNYDTTNAVYPMMPLDIAYDNG